jgi:ATP-dependent protease HslVU (ClpYQ) ATPase subunit
MFDAPDQLPLGGRLVVSAEMVKDRLADVIEDQDLSRYIL